MQEGTLDDELRRRAVGEAHHLAGSVGSFGFTEATRLARVLEHAFGDPERLGQREAPRLAEVVATLRRNLEGPPGSSAAE
ncbi:MAG: Hpt domain-containing protein [Deltaproteobacteria bacterium]|nr:Hpt domain-containing protein [Deltaproteobacteria bacterium]